MFSALRLPLVDTSAQAVAFGLREEACAASLQRDSRYASAVCQHDRAAVLLLVTEATCASCQALLPSWGSFEASLGTASSSLGRSQGLGALLCSHGRAGDDEGTRPCLAPAHADITARRLSPTLEMAVRAVPVLALLAPDGYTTGAGGFYAQYELGLGTFGVANVTAWAKRELQGLRALALR